MARSISAQPYGARSGANVPPVQPAAPPLLSRHGNAAFNLETGAVNLEAMGGWVFLLSLLASFVVIVEPAMTDLLFVLSALILLAVGKIRLSGYAIAYCLIAYAFFIANSISAVSCKSLFHCTRYLFITMYLVAIPIVMSHLAATFGPRFLDWMYKAFLGAVALSAATGVLARFGMMPGPTDLYFREVDGLRLSPFFKDPNVYGPFLAAGFLIYLGHMVAGARRLLPGLAILSLIWLSLFLAFSRAAWLAIAVAALAFLVMVVLFVGDRRSRNRMTLIVVAGLALVIPITAVILQAFDLLWFFENRLGLQSYDSHRFSGHKEAVAVGVKYPLGIGPGLFVGRNHLPGSDFTLAAHNVYLKVWVENGFLGIFTFLGFFALAFVGLARLVKRQSSRAPIHLALIASLIGLLVNGYFIDTLHWRHLFVVLGFALAELQIYEMTHSKANGHRPSLRFFRR